MPAARPTPTPSAPGARRHDAHLRGAGRATLLALVTVLTAWTAPAWADDPEILDTLGDANYFPGPEGPDLRPASYDPLDIEAVYFDTSYEEIPVGEDGIDYRPTGFVIRTRTLAPTESPGPTLFFDVTANLDGCWTAFGGFAAGPLTLPSDDRDGTVDWSTAVACEGPPAGDTVRHRNAAWSTDLVGKEAIIRIPFGSLTPEQAALLKVGGALTGIRVSIALSVSVQPIPIGPITFHGYRIDQTSGGLPYVIGSDVPEDIPCTIGCPMS